MEVEVSPLPTAILSTQTDGFDSYVFADQTDLMKRILTHWRTVGLSVDAVYSGFLGSVEQISLVHQVIDWQKGLKPHVLAVVDPVLGDEGQLYGPMEAAMVPAMRKLVAAADITTPNMTEACLLCGVQWKADWTEAEALDMVKRLGSFGPRHAVITGISLKNDDGKHYAVACSDGRTGKSTLHVHERYPVSLPGGGDLFASLVCGLMIRGWKFSKATDRAAGLTALAVQKTRDAGCERRHGVAVALILPAILDLVRSELGGQSR